MNYGIDVVVTKNRVQDANQTFIENLTPYLSAPFSFSSRSMGGYSQASLDLAVTDVKAWQILTQYLGCRIAFISPYANNADGIVWEGLVYTVGIDDGKNTVSRTMANIANKIYVGWNGPSGWVGPFEDTGSQAAFGLRELDFPSSAGEPWIAGSLGRMLLKERAWPITAPSLARTGSNASPSDVRLTIECAGIWEHMDKRVWGDLSNEHNMNADIVVGRILTKVAQFASSDQSHINTNVYQLTPRWYGGFPTTPAQTTLLKICSFGGVNLLRWFLQFRENGNAYYFEEPTTPAYYTRRLDPSEAIRDYNTGVVVPPWMVMPGAIMYVGDIMPDEVVYPTVLGDPRAFLIDEVKYTSPNKLEITPVIEEPSQLKLARIASGLGGS